MFNLCFLENKGGHRLNIRSHILNNAKQQASQEMCKQMEQGKVEAKTWQEEYKQRFERKETKSAAKEVVPDTIDLSSYRHFMPPVQAGSLWHEHQTDRIRCACKVADKRITKSVPVTKYGLSGGVQFLLQWLWQQHCEATGQGCPLSFKGQK